MEAQAVTVLKRKRLIHFDPGQGMAVALLFIVEATSTILVETAGIAGIAVIVETAVIVEAADADKGVAEQGAFFAYLCLIAQVLEGTTAAPAVKRAARVLPQGRRLHDFQQFRLSPGFMTAYDTACYQIAGSTEVHKDSFALKTEEPGSRGD